MWNPTSDLFAVGGLAFPVLVVLVPIVWCHVHATKTKFPAASCALELLTGKGRSTADRTPDFQRRFNEELFVARGELMEHVSAVMIHFVLFFCLGTAWNFLEDPSLPSLCQFLTSLFAYVWVFVAPEMVKSQTPFRLCKAIVLSINTLFIIGCANETDLARFDAADRIATVGTICTSIAMIDFEVIMSFYVCESVVLIYSRWSLIGFASLTPYLVLMPVASYTVAGGVIALSVLTMQSNIAAKLDNGEVTSFMLGFQQVLRGVCDGDLVLDRRSMTIVDDAGCLERVLKSNKKLSNTNFLDLFLDSESRQQFSKFVEAETESSRMPRGLRVSLQGARGPVSMDLFCTALPRFGAVSDYCLLAMKEDPVEQLQTVPPEAPPDSAPERIHQPAEAESRSRTSRSSLSEIVAAYDDLTEIALLVSDVTGLLDIEEAHLSFHRNSTVSNIESGMPTLRRFIRPLDWDRIERMFSTVLNLPPADQLERCYFRRPTLFRIPGESRRYLCARHTSLRLADESVEPGRPTRFWMHLAQFDSSRIRRPRQQQLEEIEEEQ